jgi:TRAP-type C4-dicarboxylate transport system permease large subunit
MKVQSAAPDHGQEEFSEHGVQRRLGDGWLTALNGIALAFSTYQLIVAAFHPLSSLVIRSLHVGFLLCITFILYPAFKSGGRLSKVGAGDTALAFGALALSTYHWVFEAELIQRSGDPSNMDLFVGTALVILTFEATRRILGLALPIVCGIFLLYGLFGQYLPGDLAHRGYGFDQIVNQLALGTEGIFGIPTLVSATYIFLFILFGSFLEHAGMINLFNSLALGFVGHTKGGAAKVSVISSALMGTISGSGVANVLTTGQFTIPLMKKFGYSGVFAGAVEATSSMGGQIMPPVMGAVAFIMAENLNVPYADIVKAAAIPAILYYLTAFWMVHLEAGRKNLVGMPKAECPNPWHAMRDNWYLLLPLIVLVITLFNGFTPMFAGMVGLVLTAVLILGAAIAARVSSTAFRYVFWVALGLTAAVFVKNMETWGIVPLLALIAALVAQTFALKGGRKTLHLLAHEPGRRRPPGAAGGCGLRHRRRHHRRADADRRRVLLRRLHPQRRREEPVPLAGADHAGVPGAGHGHSDHPQLHHHQFHRRAGPVEVGRAADRQPHVRLLLRHHGRPDAAGGAGCFCRKLDRQGVGDEDRHQGGADRHRRFRDSLHGGVYPGADAAGRLHAGGRRLHRVQGGAVDRPLGCGRDRLPVRAAQHGLNAASRRRQPSCWSPRSRSPTRSASA